MDSQLYGYNYFTGSGTNCTPSTVSAYGLAAAFTNATYWNNQPGVSGAGMAASFARNGHVGSTCTALQQPINVTALAQRWLHDGATNNGIGVWAGTTPTTELVTANYHVFYSSEQAGGTPILAITYNRSPPMTSPTATGGTADGVRIMSTSPTLAVTAVTDPDAGDTVKYWFRGTANADAETGRFAIESGWQASTTFQVPPGNLVDGLTYRWHAYTWDSVVANSWTLPTWTWSFTVDLHLGAEAAAPYDAIGPAQVNLVSGNVAVGAGSPAGLSYAYNSSTPMVTGAAVGSYYNDVNNNDIIDDPLIMERRDPTIGFTWGPGGPGGGVWADNFLVRWTASVTVPVVGNYRFYSTSDDGMRIWVDGTDDAHRELNRWGQGADPIGTYSDVVVATTTHKTFTLQVEYMEVMDNAYANVWIEGVYGTPAAPAPPTPLILKLAPLDPTWLGADTPPLPVGWTFSAGLGYSSARVVDDHVVLTDASGAPHVFSGRAGGYVPPPEDDGVLALDANGSLTLHATDGVTYAFDPGGRLVAATAATDDLATSRRVLKYVSDGGRGSRLVRMTDPVSGRSTELHYYHFDEDPATRPLHLPRRDHRLHDPPPDALCSVDYWVRRRSRPG